jgi:tetratricopeptide (TPR) repeat protein
MSPSSEREEALFAEALALPESERAAFLDRACDCDATLRARLAALLAAHAAPDSVLGQAVTLPPQRPDEQPGNRIGRYKLLQKIGEGGCGTVYMAEQDEPVRRRVALKVVKLGMDTREVITRFEAERQALALMDHPNIARVFDAGSTATGRPYFVMELVRGVPLTQYCDENTASTAQRLELFIQVCHAVQHAHQKGVIHRDIKPSNILVTINDNVAVPKVIDFGIAKATQGRLTDHTLFTAFQQFIGTPAYMSPEQAVMTSLDVDTRADIYSLGVLLYELLTGRTPFDAKELVQAGLDEIRRRIREVEPPKPSTRLSTMEGAALAVTAHHRQTEPPKLLSLVRGDLDWIVMRCLEKDRTRRYETANGLADDLRRHLNHEPVSACPPSAAYLLQKLVRRHRTAFASAAAIAATLVLGATFATWQAVRATRAEKQAQAERDVADTARRAEARARALAEQRRTEAETARAGEAAQRLQAEANEKKAQTEAARSRQVAQFMKGMLKGVGPRVALGRDTKLLRDILDATAKRLDQDLAGQPMVEAELRMTLGAVYDDLGDFPGAVAMYQKALALYREELGSEHLAVASALCALGQSLLDFGKPGEAVTPLREALAIQRKLNSEIASNVTTPLVRALARIGRADEAEAVLRERLTLAKSRWGEPSRPVAGAMVSLGFELGITLGRSLEEAEAVLRAAIQMWQKVGNSDGTSAIGALNSLAVVLNGQRKFAEAEATYREALPLWRKRYGQEHPDLATGLGNFATVLMAQGKLAEAESVYREIVLLQRKMLGNEHPSLAAYLVRLGNLLTIRGQLTEADAVLQEALAIQNKCLLDSYKLTTLSYLIQLHTARRDWTAAESCHRERLEITRSLHGSDSPEFVNTLTGLSRFLRQRNRPAEADEVDREIADVKGRLADADRGRLPRSAASRGAALFEQGRWAEAEEAYREELTQWRQKEGDEGVNVFRTLYYLAMVYSRENNLAEAEATLREAVRIGFKRNLPLHISALNNLGYMLMRQDRLGEAETTLREALDLLKKAPRSHITATSGFLAETLHRQHKEAEVEALWREAIDYARQRYGPESEDVANYSASLVTVLVRADKFAEAEPPARECLALRDKLAPESWRAHEARSVLGHVLGGRKKFAEAEPLLLSAFEGLSASAGSAAQKPLEETVTRLVQLYTAWGKPAQAAAWKERPGSLQDSMARVESLRQENKLGEAETAQRQIVDSMRRRFGTESLSAAGAIKELALILVDAGKPVEAEPLARESLSIRTKLLPAENWLIATSRSAVGKSLLGQKNYAEAEPLLLSAYADIKERGPKPPTAPYFKSLISVARALVALYQETNQPARVAEWQQIVDRDEKSLGALPASATRPSPPPGSPPAAQPPQ